MSKTAKKWTEVETDYIKNFVILDNRFLTKAVKDELVTGLNMHFGTYTSHAQLSRKMKAVRSKLNKNVKTQPKKTQLAKDLYEGGSVDEVLKEKGHYDDIILLPSPKLTFWQKVKIFFFGEG